MTMRISKKVLDLLDQHKTEIIEQLGTSAFEVMTPQEVADDLKLTTTKRIPELIRQGWLAPIPGKDIGSAHQYYRWRAEFVKRYKQPRQEKNESPV
jgi:hypothetical protein